MKIPWGNLVSDFERLTVVQVKNICNTYIYPSPLLQGNAGGVRRQEKRGIKLLHNSFLHFFKRGRRWFSGDSFLGLFFKRRTDETRKGKKDEFLSLELNWFFLTFFNKKGSRKWNYWYNFFLLFPYAWLEKSVRILRATVELYKTRCIYLFGHNRR